MAMLKKVYHPVFAKPLKVLFTSRDPMPPAKFTACLGHIIYRESKEVVCLWDGEEWSPLGATGWYAKYSSRFPSNITVGNWAIIGPIKVAGSKFTSQRRIDLEDFTWAMRNTENAQEDFRVLADQVRSELEEQEICDERELARNG